MTTREAAVRERELTATAWHEAGHVTAYLASGLAVRYATVRPRSKSVLGMTMVRRRTIPAWDMAVIAHAGPTAQGMHAWRARTADEVEDDEREGIGEADYITGAYLTGGCDDLARAAAAPTAVTPEHGDLWESTAKQRLEFHWPVVTAIAEQLLIHKTLTGPVMRELAVTAATDAGLPEGVIYMLGGYRD